MNYKDEYNRSISNPVGFWRSQAELLSWFNSPSTILTKDQNGVDRWFEDGELNTAYLALDYHVEQGRGDQTAIIYDSPVTQTIEKLSYIQLRDRVARFAGVLSNLGASKGDRVLIYLPMIPEAAIAMLACARLGAVHSVVFGGFAAHEIAVRIDDATPDIIITASCGIEVDKVLPYLPIVVQAMEQAQHKVSHCIIYQRKQHIADLSTQSTSDVNLHHWQSLEELATPAPYVTVRATDPLYILYTSGTTGRPKGVVRDNGGHAVALKYSMKAIYNIEPGEVFWAASDVGWVVGHSYIVYAPLLAGCTSVLYEGKPVNTPDAGAFWRVCEQHKVKAIFSAPTAFRAIKKQDPEGALFSQYDLTHLDTAFLAGERTDPPTYHWLSNLLKKPVIDHWWQTETGWSIVANMIGVEQLPTKAGSASKAVPGFDVRIFDNQGQELPANESGNIVIKLPLPPSCFPTLWNDAERYHENYMADYPGYYLTGDGGYKDNEGYVFVMGRTDDVINVAGHRFSTGEMEEIIGGHHNVAECAVIGIANELRGQVPFALAILKDGVSISDINATPQQIIALVREKIGAVACLKSVVICSRLPKTRSGKILRKTLRQIADAESFDIPSTIDDPSSIKEVTDLMKENQIGAHQ